MQQTVPRNSRVYSVIEMGADGMARLRLSAIPPDYADPIAVLIWRGVLPSGNDVALELVSDPQENEALRGPAGKDGANATDVQVAAAASAYLASHPPAAGKDGANASDAQVAAAVSAWLSVHPPAAGKNGSDGKPAAALLGTLTIVQTATIAIAAGVRRVTIAVPASWGMAAGDPIVLAPIDAVAGYAIHDAVAVSATSLSIGLTGPLLAINASMPAIRAKLYRLNS